MNSFTSSTDRASTVTVQDDRWLRSMSGRTDVIRTSSGSVVFELVEQRGPRERPAIDEVVRLPRVNGDGVDLARIDAGPQLERAVRAVSAARVSSCAAWEASSVLLPES